MNDIISSRGSNLKKSQKKSRGDGGGGKGQGASFGCVIRGGLSLRQQLVM